jgi:hypothetical protein
MFNKTVGHTFCLLEESYLSLAAFLKQELVLDLGLGLLDYNLHVYGTQSMTTQS